jgi:cell division protein FtsA
MNKRDKTKIVVGLDAGSYRTRCVIAALEGDCMRYLAHGLAPSAGWVKGRVSDQQAVADSMRAAVEDAERGAGLTVTEVTLGIGGLDIVGAQSRGLYEFGRPREVSAEDLAYAVEMAAEVRLERDRMLLHVLPQDFTLDGRAGYRRPDRGVCSRLEANVHLLTASMQQHQAIVSAAHLAHLTVEETVFETMAAAYACVRPEERSRGVAVVDLGMDSTGIVIYDGDRLLLGSSLEVASDHLTRDIAWIFKVSYEDAECLKQQYGCALLGLTADSSLIEVPSPEGRAPREARRSDLIDILEARCEQMFRFVRSEIQRAGMEHSLLEGVMLTGAGALLNGMYDVAEKVLDCQTCYGLAKGIGDWPAELENPAWTVAAGLAMYSAKIKLHRPPENAARGLMGFLVK